MFNSTQLLAFVQKLQHTLPGIQAIQIITTDGLALFSDSTPDEDYRHPALAAMLHSAAEQLVRHINPLEVSRGTLICGDNTAYLVTPLGQDCMLGLQIPADMGQPWLLQTVTGLIQDHALPWHRPLHAMPSYPASLRGCAS